MASRYNLWVQLQRLNAWQRILLALIAGISLGSVMGPSAACFKPIGSIFINSINMMVTPVVFTAIVCAVISIDDSKRMKRLGLKTVGLYTVSMAAAAALGMLIAVFIGPGKNFHPDLGVQTLDEKSIPSLIDTIVNIVPANPVNAFAHGNIIQILVFALLLGISINLTGKAAAPVANFFKAFSQVVFRLTGIVMSFAPIGIFALMAWVSGEFGLSALLPLFKLVLTVYVACILHCILFYGSSLFYVAKLSPRIFFKRIMNPMLLAFTSSSSAATLPVTMKTAEKQLGIPSDIGQFLLPLGTTLNLNGLSIYLGVATIFAANIYGVHLGFVQYITVVFSIILTCMGAGGIPGTGIIAMSAVMSSVGLPLGAIPLIAGVDRLNDMAQTTTNVVGDLFATTLIAKQEGELDLKAFYQASSNEAEADPSPEGVIEVKS